MPSTHANIFMVIVDKDVACLMKFFQAKVFFDSCPIDDLIFVCKWPKGKCKESVEALTHNTCLLRFIAKCSNMLWIILMCP